MIKHVTGAVVYHVDVRFTNKQIGTTTDADLITLADNAVAVAGTLTVSDDVKLSEANAVIEHTLDRRGCESDDQE